MVYGKVGNGLEFYYYFIFLPNLHPQNATNSSIKSSFGNKYQPLFTLLKSDLPLVLFQDIHFLFSFLTQPQQLAAATSRRTHTGYSFL